jgi:GxxExxY protein
MLHEDLTHRILAAAVEVHKALGPCLTEASYQAAMALEMSAVELSFEREPIWRSDIEESRSVTIDRTS